MKESMDPNANIFEEYLATVDSILGFYLDTLVAYGYSLRYLDEGQKAAIAEFKRRGEDWSVEDLDAKSLIFGEGDPNTSDAVVLHQTTEGQYKARNRKGGSNHRIIGNLCIVLLYQYWEDHFRSNFAEVLKMHKNDLLVDEFGDLRQFRRAIIHNNGIATREVASCKCFKWFTEGQAIHFTQDQIKTIIRSVAQVPLNYAKGRMKEEIETRIRREMPS
jgi:hypothetical protein